MHRQSGDCVCMDFVSPQIACVILFIIKFGAAQFWNLEFGAPGVGRVGNKDLTSCGLTVKISADEYQHNSYSQKIDDKVSLLLSA